MAGFLKRISSMLPNFAGIKYTDEDFMDFLTCLSYNEGAYDMLWGRDECLLSALVLGCRAVFSEVKLGLIPATVAPFLLRRSCGGKMMEYLLTGRKFSGHDAVTIGLINRVCTR